MLIALIILTTSGFCYVTQGHDCVIASWEAHPEFVGDAIPGYNNGCPGDPAAS